MATSPPPRSSRTRSPSARLASATLAPACGTSALVAGIGLSLSLVICVGTWALAPHEDGASVEAPVRLAVGVWLLAHHVGLDLSVGMVSLVPIGLLLVPSALLYGGGRHVGRRVRLASPSEVVRTVIPYALTYGVVLAVVAGAARSADVGPHPLAAFSAGVVLALVFGALGMVAVSGLTGQLWQRVPIIARHAVAGAGAALATLTAFAAIAVALLLAMGFPESVDMFRTLSPDLAGGLVVALVGVAFIPNLIVWAVAFSTGVGFSLGAESSLSPQGIHYDALPVFPPLSAVPPEGEPGALALLALVGPLVAGVVAGLVVHRRLRREPPDRVALVAGGAGLLSGLALLGLCWLSAGSVGAAQLSVVGPVGWRVGLVGGLEIALVAAAIAWEAHRRVWDGRRIINLRKGVGSVLTRGARSDSRSGVGIRH